MNVHLDTLRATIEKTNAEAADNEPREQKVEHRDEQPPRSHEETVREISRRLHFD